MWVRIPNLPVHCWDIDSLQRIGNGIRNFIDKVDNKGQYTCARICVEVDLEASLPEAIKTKSDLGLITRNWIMSTCLSSAGIAKNMATSKDIVPSL